MTYDLLYLTSICGTHGLVQMGDGSIISIEKVETLISTAVVEESPTTISIRDVAYVHLLTIELLSVSYI